MSPQTLRVLLVCQWYPPEPAAIPEGIALALKDGGMHVDVLTGVPNYPTGVVPHGYSASRLSCESRHGIMVRRVPLYPSHDSSAVKRITNYVSWAVSASIFGQPALRRADAALVYSSPATAALPAMVARRLWGTPYVLLIQDVWPDSVFASGFLPGPAGRVVYSAMNWFVRRTYEQADHVATTSPGMADLLALRGVPREKLSVIYNWVPEEGPSAPSTRPPQPPSESLAAKVGVPNSTRLFLYAGNHGHAQALDGLVRAFLDDRTAPAHLVMLGDGVTKEQLTALADGHKRVHFLDSVDRSEAANLLNDADVSVVSLSDEALFAATMPSKVQSGLASARPLLVVARGDAATTVVEATAGAAAAPGNLEQLIEAVRMLSAATPSELGAMGARGREVYQSQMTRAVGASRLSCLLIRAASRRTRRGGHTAATHPERKCS